MASSQGDPGCPKKKITPREGPAVWDWELCQDPEGREKLIETRDDAVLTSTTAPTPIELNPCLRARLSKQLVQKIFVPCIFLVRSRI